MFMRFIRTEMYSSSSFISDRCIDGNVILSSIDQHLGCFQNFAIINSVAMNIFACVSWTPIAGLYIC